MKALGHQRRLSDVLRMSALPLIADLSLRCRERSKRANNRLAAADMPLRNCLVASLNGSGLSIAMQRRSR
jgi:hypothetical protein